MFWSAVTAQMAQAAVHLNAPYQQTVAERQEQKKKKKKREGGREQRQDDDAEGRRAGTAVRSVLAMKGHGGRN